MTRTRYGYDVPVEIVSAILRYGSVHFTRKDYTKRLPECIADAMQGLVEKK